MCEGAGARDGGDGDGDIEAVVGQRRGGVGTVAAPT